jgi:hypothetical protein
MNKEIVEDAQGALKNKRIWYDTPDPDFVEISLKSLLQPGWLDYRPVMRGENGANPMRPLSNYVENIGHKPSLVSIVGNTARIRFYLYADIYLNMDKQTEELYHVDRTWMRQYYLTKKVIDDTEGQCFDGTFKFFVPWFLDENVEVSYEPCSDVESPVLVEPFTDFWHKPIINSEAISKPMFLSPHFVYFKFKKHGSHMKDEDFGIARRGAPIFDILVTVSDIIIERIKEQYAYN